MKKLALLLFIFAFSSVSVFPQVINEILRRMEAHQKALKTLQADITIQKFSVQFGGTYTKTGVVKFLPQRTDYLLRIDSTTPVTESFATVGNQYLVYLPNLQNAYTGTITDPQKNMCAIFSVLSSGKYKADYNLRYFGQEKMNGTIPTVHLGLEPKMAQSYQKIELWVDGNGMPLQAKVIEKNGDWTIVLLKNLQKNIVLKSNEFQIKLPKEIKPVKN